MQLMIADRQNSHDAVRGELIASQLQERRHRAGCGLPIFLNDPIRLSLAVLAIFGNLLFAGCVTPQPIQNAAHAVDFGRYKTVHFTVHDTPQTEYAAGADGAAYGKETVVLLKALLSTRLATNYAVVDGPADLDIDVVMTEIKPGNAAARWLVGFGAGRADTEFQASFSDASGLIASFRGGRSFTGMEANVSPYSGKSDLSSLAATRCVDQIMEFIARGGVIPKK